MRQTGHLKVELWDTAYGPMWLVEDLEGQRHWFSTKGQAEGFLRRYRAKVMQEGQ